MLVAALGRAGGMFAAEAELGRLTHVDGEGGRTYQRQNGPDFHLTIVSRDGSSLRYEVLGVDGTQL
jgi:hypothetical protein